MPTRDNPTPPGFHELGTIQANRSDRSSASWRLADDKRSLRAPAEMIQPDLLSWVEETHDFPGVRVGSGDSIALVIVAHRAREPEVLLWR